MTLWLTSDSHFGHANIIRFCNRPFSSVEEMNEILIERWNAVVRPGDHVYHLGDVALRGQALQLVRRLNGAKRLVLGNHDIDSMRAYAAVGFQKIFGSRILDGCLLTHIPAAPPSFGRFRANIHGHTHQAAAYPPLPDGRPYVNVCVEHTFYTPVTLESVTRASRRC